MPPYTELECCGFRDTVGGLIPRISDLDIRDERRNLGLDHIGVLEPRLLIGTSNTGKVRELSSALAGCRLDIVSPADIGIVDDIAETGTTLEENALLKATAYSEMSGLLTLADDSGLEVDALGGEPGVMSSRYAGEGKSDSERIAFLLWKLNNIGGNSWPARFRCVIAVKAPGGPADLYTGICPGRIVRKARGSNGFGYDPVFFLPGLGRTMAELTQEEKDRVSHRGKAAHEAAEALRRLTAPE
jgi:XTP/dITP diphosphohydrolase